jgi:signal transduction histidine kinase
MKGWYKSLFIKGLLIVIAVAGGIFISAYVSIMAFTGHNAWSIFDIPERYEDSVHFERQLQGAIRDVTGGYWGRVTIYDEREIVGRFPRMHLATVGEDVPVWIDGIEGRRWVWIGNEEDRWTYELIGGQELIIEIDGRGNQTLLVEDRGTWVEGEASTHIVVEDGFGQYAATHWIHHGWTEGNTNFTYIIVDQETGRVVSNRRGLRDFENLHENIQNIRQDENMRYLIIADTIADFESNLNLTTRLNRTNREMGLNEGMIFIGAVNMNLPIMDSFYWENQNFQLSTTFLRNYVWVFIGSIVLLIGSLIWLTAVAGRNNKNIEVNLNWFDNWKTEIAAAVVLTTWFTLTITLADRVIWWGNNLRHVTFVAVYGAGTIALFLIGYLSLVRRIKGKTLWSNSLIVWLNTHVQGFWSNRDAVLRGFLIVMGFIGIHWLALVSGGFILFVLIMLIVDGLAVFIVVKNAVDRQKIKAGIKEIALGNTTYQISLVGLRGEIYKTAEMVNGIGAGLQQAIDEGMRSERMKTDLITNVSHDIKTPLTSIINYVGLLKLENLKDEKIQGYLQILEEKAQRLKVLTEDVIEASKVSSGNISFEKTNINLGEMLHQAEGEFEERFKNKNLTLISSIPEEPIVIHVDGRRMWRVIENIFNNVEKYALPGSRVYGDLLKDKQTIVYSLKNISDQPLNITADELTERFIRGDVSRGTEGSGLGLSIAKSLTQLQGGQFRLYLDGDLFKVIIEFPAV